ncbi:MAG: hypothetical protein ACKVVP_16260 [Chloroflexota bacterium]
MADRSNRIAELETLYAELEAKFFGGLQVDGQAHDMPYELTQVRRQMDAVKEELARLKQD